jgi:N-hydroxyarylamine O-acetyltransferase
MNLDAYLARTGFAGVRAASRQTLGELVFAHACHIPFENLDVLLGRGIDLAEEAVEAKLVRAGRGGYCFEQNALFARVLAALGFTATLLSARVRYNQPTTIVSPRTHVFVRIDLDGVPWLADVGIGGISPTAPLRLDLLDEPQPTPHDTRRIVRVERRPFPHYMHQVRFGAEWVDVCEFTMEEMPFIDRVLANWYTSTHPESRFRKNLIAALARPDGTRLNLMNRELVHRRGADVLDRQLIGGPDELLRVLAERFGLELPPGTLLAATELSWDDPH